MIVKDYKDGKIITFSKPLDSRAKILYAFYFLTFFTTSLFFFYFLLTEYDISIVANIIAIIAVVAFCIAAFRFGNKAFMREELFISKKDLQLIRQGILPENRISYDITKISNFRHLDKPELTKHPLAGETFDYLGFQTEQKVISEMHGDNRLAFDYENKTVTFGENIYSWEFDELQILLYDITGNDFSYDDEFEKTFKPKE
jgi:hypothetical protein